MFSFAFFAFFAVKLNRKGRKGRKEFAPVFADIWADSFDSVPECLLNWMFPNFLE